MLSPADGNLRKIHDLAPNPDLLTSPVLMSGLIYRSFIPAEIKPVDIQ